MISSNSFFLLKMYFFKPIKKMDYIAFEANEENPPLIFCDVEDEITNDELEDFIDDTDQQREDLNLYRQLDPENIKHYPQFCNQTRNPKEVIYEDDQPYFRKEDTQPELYEPKFSGFEKSVKKFKENSKRRQQQRKSFL